MFGSGFGGQRPSGSQSGFGFGQTQPQTTQPSLFGQPAASAPQAGSAFGAPAGTQSGGLFGSQANTQAAAPFGAPAGNTMNLGGTQQQGTAKAAFVATEMPDPAKGLSKTDRFQTITMMPAYQNMSVNELRWQDYQANQKGPTSSGSVSAFGFGTQPAPSQSGGGLFGQQQASSSPFGGAPTTNSAFGSSANTGGGLFGRSNSTTTPSTGLFGSTGTQNGSSAFGGPSNTGGSLFGQNNSSTSAFGQSAAPSTGTGFGFNQGNTATGTGMFGQSNTSGSTGLFGSNQGTTGSGFGQNNTAGSGNTGFGFGTQPQASAQPSGAFGATGGGGLFGQNNTSNAGSSAFGQNNASSFGSTSNNTGGGLFGQNQNQGQNQGGGLFGSNNANTGTSGFGFGAQNNNTSGGLFGGSNNNSSTTGGGLFGQNNSQPSGGIFGSNSGNTLGQQPGSGFGSTQNKPAVGFGSTAGGAFGQPNNSFGGGTTGSSTGGGLFGQNNNSSQPGTSPGFGFGQNNASNAAPNTSGSLFGQSQPPKTGFGFGQPASNTGANSGASGLFGSNANKPATGGLFGSGSSSNPTAGGSLFGNNNASTPSTGGGGLFGNSGATNPAANTTSSGFGANNNAAGASGGGLFGNSNTNTGGGLFGNKPATGTGTGLFGSSTTSNNAGAAKPAFGSTSTTGGSSLFGGSGGLGNNQSQPNQGGGGLFGSANTNKPTTGLFGNASTTNSTGPGLSFGNASNAPAPSFGNQGAGGSLFAQQQPSGPVASIGSNAYGSNPLFSNVQQPAATSTQNDQPQAVPKKDDASFKPPTGVLLAHIMQPHQLLVKRQKWGSGRNHKDAEDAKTLEEYSKVPPWPASAATATESSPQSNEKRSKLGGATGFASVRFRNVLFSNNTDDIILNSEAFDLTRHRAPAAPRNVIEVDEAPRAVSVSTPTKVSAKANEESSILPEAAPNAPLSESIADGSEAQLSQASRFGVDATGISQTDQQEEEESDATGASLTQPEPDTPDNEIVNDEGYWISPAQHRLTNMTLREIRKIKGFRVGQRTHGFVEFLDPVDLSAYSNVQAQVSGRIVVISDRSFCLYPIESERPPVGQGFNVKHRVTLYNVFARTRDTQEPIKDPEHPICKKFVKRLRTKGTFVSWSAQIGTWTFEVDPAKDNVK